MFLNQFFAFLKFFLFNFFFSLFLLAIFLAILDKYIVGTDRTIGGLTTVGVIRGLV